MLHSDIIPGDLESNIWRNNAWDQLYTENKESEYYWKATEWWLNGTEWSLKCICHSVDWMVTERWLNGAFQFSRNGGVSSCGAHFCKTWKPYCCLRLSGQRQQSGYIVWQNVFCPRIWSINVSIVTLLIFYWNNFINQQCRFHCVNVNHQQTPPKVVM